MLPAFKLLQPSSTCITLTQTLRNLSMNNTITILYNNYHKHPAHTYQRPYGTTTSTYQQSSASQSTTTPQSTDIVPTEPSTNSTLHQQPISYMSTATRQQSVAHHHNMRIKHRKLNDLCRLIRGLSVNEAIIQLKLTNKKYHSLTIIKCISNAATSGVVNFNMNYDRLYIAEALVGKAESFIVPDIKGRGRTGMIEIGYSHLTIIVREQLPNINSMIYNKIKNTAYTKYGAEKKIGRFGPTLATQQKHKLYAESIKNKESALQQAKNELNQDT